MRLHVLAAQRGGRALYSPHRRPGPGEGGYPSVASDAPRCITDAVCVPSCPCADDGAPPDDEGRPMTILGSPTGADYRPATTAAVTVLAAAGVPVHLPGTDAYAALTGTSNLTKAIRPVAVVAVRDAADITRTVRVAASAGLRVAVQSTGHGATETM